MITSSVWIIWMPLWYSQTVLHWHEACPLSSTTQFWLAGQVTWSHGSETKLGIYTRRPGTGYEVIQETMSRFSVGDGPIFNKQGGPVHIEKLVWKKVLSPADVMKKKPDVPWPLFIKKSASPPMNICLINLYRFAYVGGISAAEKKYMSHAQRERKIIRSPYFAPWKKYLSPYQMHRSLFLANIAPSLNYEVKTKNDVRV